MFISCSANLWVLESSAKPMQSMLCLADDSRTKDFQLGLFVLILIRQAPDNYAHINTLVDLELNVIIMY